MDLKHTDNTSTDQSSIKLSTSFRRALTVQQWTYTLDNHKCVWKNNDKCIFPTRGRSWHISSVSMLSCELYCLRWLGHKQCHCEQTRITGSYSVSFLLLAAGDDASVHSYVTLSNYFWASENANIMHKNVSVPFLNEEWRDSESAPSPLGIFGYQRL